MQTLGAPKFALMAGEPLIGDLPRRSATALFHREPGHTGDAVPGAAQRLQGFSQPEAQWAYDAGPDDRYSVSLAAAG